MTSVLSLVYSYVQWFSISLILDKNYAIDRYSCKRSTTEFYVQYPEKKTFITVVFIGYLS